MTISRNKSQRPGI